LIAGLIKPELVVLFKARRHLCAVSVTRVQETMRPLPITPLAAMPFFILGLSLIRGATTPVVDVGAVLGAEDAPNTARFITLRINERCVALAVESVLGVREISPASLQRLPPLLRDASVEVVSSIGMLDAEFLLVLRAARLLTEAVENTFDLQEA
jgi:purine-binding chemotaxis protein CheW